MKQAIIYALDFDGVICDSALETGISGWKAASQIWNDFSTALPTKELSAQFREIRPIMGTGYEAILIVRLLNNGETVKAIMEDYQAKTQQVLKDSALNIDQLKKLFGETRDHWINENMTEWVEMNPLFPRIAEKLQQIPSQDTWYIITTKQERFVKQILQANNIQLADERIFGLGRNMSKEAVLTDLVSKHKNETIYFVEDMLPTLLKIIKNDKLKTVKLFLALWGYNTAQHKLDAEKQAITLINREEFLL
ncbi:MAG: HAD family hydrolase [Methylococcales bacterium]|nr:HAD family hydrolase [Methylococcales bacterium]